MTESIEAIFARQDQLITRTQALTFLSDNEILSRLGRRWRVVLPGIYASGTGPLTGRQRIRAALLRGGPGSMLNDATALAVHRIPYLPDDLTVRLLVADTIQRGSKDFVVIRRTTRLPAAVSISGLAVAPVYRAVCEFVARHSDERESLAVAAAAVQLGRATVQELVTEALLGPARGRPRQLRVYEPLRAGVRSLPEADFRQLVLGRRSLPEPLWNCLLQLPDGSRFSPDALFDGAALIHETNGRQYHAPDEAGEDRFEDMQRRGDRLTAAGFTVLDNSPRRLRSEGRAVIREVEQCYLRESGRGLPPGVVILRAGPPGTPWLVEPMSGRPSTPMQCGIALVNQASSR